MRFAHDIFSVVASFLLPCDLLSIMAAGSTARRLAGPCKESPLLKEAAAGRARWLSCLPPALAEHPALAPRGLFARVIEHYVCAAGVSGCSTSPSRRPALQLPGMESVVPPGVSVAWGSVFPKGPGHGPVPVEWQHKWQSTLCTGDSERVLLLGIAVGEGGMLAAAFGFAQPSLDVAVASASSAVVCALFPAACATPLDVLWRIETHGGDTVPILAPQHADNARESILSSHPRVLHRLRHLPPPYESPVPTTAVQPLDLDLFLPASTFAALMDLASPALDHAAAEDALLRVVLGPIEAAVRRLSDDTVTVKEVVIDLTTPKGVWRCTNGAAEVARVDASELWRKRSDHFRLLARRGHLQAALRELTANGIFPLALALRLAT